jgi:hypothetical protein
VKRDDNKATLVKQWTHAGTSYRLVSAGRWSRGFNDSYILERSHKDALGGDNWSELQRWDADDAKLTLTILAAGVAA